MGTSRQPARNRGPPSTHDTPDPPSPCGQGERGCGARTRGPSVRRPAAPPESEWGAGQTQRGCKMKGRRSPTLPPGGPGSTIGREELNFCVRYGNRWVLLLVVTVQVTGPRSGLLDPAGEEPARWTENGRRCWFGKAEEYSGISKPNGSLVLVSFTHCCASTSSLSTLWSSRTLQGEFILRGASHLDAFSGYPVRTWLPGGAAGATTGTPEVRPPRSSRTRGSSSQLSYAHGR